MKNNLIAKTPKPPYYAVIFTSIRAKLDKGYSATSEKMVDLAQVQPGFLGIETARSELGITVSYWKDIGSISRWKQNTAHLIAQSKGKAYWYENYTVRISKVEKDYGPDQL